MLIDYSSLYGCLAEQACGGWTPCWWLCLFLCLYLWHVSTWLDNFFIFVVAEHVNALVNLHHLMGLSLLPIFTFSAGWLVWLDTDWERGFLGRSTAIQLFLGWGWLSYWVDRVRSAKCYTWLSSAATILWDMCEFTTFVYYLVVAPGEHVTCKVAVPCRPCGYGACKNWFFWLHSPLRCFRSAVKSAAFCEHIEKFICAVLYQATSTSSQDGRHSDWIAAIFEACSFFSSNLVIWFNETGRL